MREAPSGTRSAVPSSPVSPPDPRPHDSRPHDSRPPDLRPHDPRAFGPPCPGCGHARTAADAAGLAWSSRHGRGGVEFVCPACTRADIELIETGAAYATVRRAG